MTKYFKAIALALFTAVLTSGCAVNFDERLASLEKKTEAMDGRLGSVESRQDSIEQRQTAVEEYVTRQKPEAAAKAPAMSNEDVQAALKNTGYYNGAIDGKVGPNTDRAIREFQKANGLEPDGVVGARTRTLLSKYLSRTSQEQAAQ